MPSQDVSAEALVRVRQGAPGAAVSQPQPTDQVLLPIPVCTALQLGTSFPFLKWLFHF